MRKIFLAVILFLFLPFPFALRADEPRSGLFDAVLQGQKQLAAYKIPKPKKLIKNENRIALAVLDTTTGEVKIVNISVIGKAVKAIDEPKWRIELKRDNGVNSEFRVATPEDKLVVAMKYPVMMRKQTSKGEIRVLTDVVYTAYSPDLESPEIIANGQAYVDNLINTSYEKMNTLGVKSRAFPDRLITEALNKQMVESLILIEHIGTTTLLGDFDGALRRLYATFGLNTVNTFDYSRSSAGARGIAQFMPNTYKAVRAKRPELGLKSNFEEAMMDHENATLAQLALMDLHLAALPPEIHERAIADPVATGEYLAASYNGGVGRVLYTLKNWGDAWHEDHKSDIAGEEARHKSIDARIAQLKKRIAKAKTAAEAKKLRAELAAAQKEHDALVSKIARLKKGSLRLETVNYLKKLRPVYAHLSVRQEMIKRQDLAMREAASSLQSATVGKVAGKIKFQTDPKVYVLYEDGTIRWITSESLAVALYGLDWNKNIEELSDALFANYKLNDPVDSLDDFENTKKDADTVPSQIAFGG